MRRRGRHARLEQRTQATHTIDGEQRARARRRLARVRRAQRNSSRRSVGQTHQPARLPADHPMPLHDKCPPRERMRRRDDHHLRGHRSAQLTQCVRYFVSARNALVRSLSGSRTRKR